jgi:hypothetical protein
MTPAELKGKCKSYETAINGKGYVLARVYLTINWLYEDNTVVCVQHRTGGYSTEHSEYIRCDLAEGWATVLGKVEKYIDGLKSVEDKKREEFVAAVGRLIDQGRDIGIEVDFLNPLTQMMEKLSSNIITHHIDPNGSGDILEA